MSDKFIEEDDKSTKIYEVENEVLLIAAKDNCFALAKFLVENGMEISDMAMDLAIQSGSSEIVKLFLEHGATLDVTSNNRYVADAAANDNLDMVKFFVELGADVDTYKGLALEIACQHNNIDIVKYLVANGANVNINHGKALSAAKRYGHKRIVDYLVEHGACVDYDDYYQQIHNEHKKILAEEE
jgi:ankyrin repeat protein